MRTGIAAILLAGSALALTACQDTDRPLSYEKGVYHGKKDTALTSEQVETLRQRGMRSYQ
jgi:hypothetical protein